MERTSALMYFLAFDAVSKTQGQGPVDFDPNSQYGRDNRKLIELEFTKLVLLNKAPGKIIQVSELGKIDCTSKDPEKRISSNFLTVPLKQASDQATQFTYPKRPPTPLMKLGQAATGLKWGIDYFDNWQVNLPKLFSDIKQSTPFTDLAIFICRDAFFENDPNDYISAIGQIISTRFSAGLAKFWIELIEKEKVFARHVSLPSSIHHEPFAKDGIKTEGIQAGILPYEQLANHIIYLEELLSNYPIEFKSIRSKL
ncbi:MAG TPA: hypothetical protein VGB50_09455 [Flavobacterium sp.]